MRDSRVITPKELKVGDKVKFVDVPYNSDDMRLSYTESTVVEIIPTKSGKRVSQIVFDNKAVNNIGWNTELQSGGKKFWTELEKERGWK